MADSHSCSICNSNMALSGKFWGNQEQYMCSSPSCNPDRYTRRFIMVNTDSTILRESVYLNGMYTILDHANKRLRCYTDSFNMKSVDMLLYKHSNLDELAAKLAKKLKNASDTSDD